VIVLLGVVAMATTGSILPWDQSGQATLSVVNAMLRSIPLLGDPIANATFGPSLSATLLRAYVFHVILLPFIVLLLTFVHLWKVRRDGMTSPEEM